MSLLALAASLGSTFGYWSNNARKIRLANLVCACPCWLLYDVLVGSWGGVLNEAITLISILVSIVRFGWSGFFDPVNCWLKFCRNVQGEALPCGHFIPEEAPELLLEALERFVKRET